MKELIIENLFELAGLLIMAIVQGLSISGGNAAYVIGTSAAM